MVALTLDCVHVALGQMMISASSSLRVEYVILLDCVIAIETI